MSKISWVNGKPFENLDPNTKLAQSIIRAYNSGLTKTWNEVYKNPSNEKKAIKRRWDDFFGDFVSKKYMGNCYNFSIYVKMFGYETYFLITKSHNYMIVA